MQPSDIFGIKVLCWHWKWGIHLVLAIKLLMVVVTITNYLDPHVVLLNGTSNVKDDGGKANSDGLPDEQGPNVNYSDNVNYSAQFDAGIGKIIMMKTNRFEFEVMTSVLYII